MKVRAILAHAVAIIAAMALSSPSIAAESAADFAGSIELKTSSNAALYRVEVPMGVYAGIRHPDMRDIRVVNASGEFVPYALIGGTLASAPAATVYTPPVFPIRGEAGTSAEQIDVQIAQRADGSVVSVRTRAPDARGAKAAPNAPLAYIVDLTRIDTNVTAITPKWVQPPENFIGSARIEASENLRDWRTVAGASPLAYLSQAGARLTQERIELPSMRTKYLRVAFSPAAPEMIAIDVEAPRPRGEVQRQSVRVAAQPGANAGEFEFDLGVRAPVDRVRILAPEPNSLAPVRLDSRPDARAEWRPVVSTVVYRMLRDAQEHVSPAVPVPPNPSPRWRAVIDQTSGGLGRKPPELEASWPLSTLIFLARGSGPFTLLFGARDATPGALPIATLVPGYRDGQEEAFPLASLGAAKGAVTAAPTALERVIGDHDAKKLGLWAALIAGVLVLGVMAWQLARQMRR